MNGKLERDVTTRPASAPGGISATSVGKSKVLCCLLYNWLFVNPTNLTIQSQMIEKSNTWIRIPAEHIQLQTGVTAFQLSCFPLQGMHNGTVAYKGLKNHPMQWMSRPSDPLILPLSPLNITKTACHTGINVSFMTSFSVTTNLHICPFTVRPLWLGIGPPTYFSKLIAICPCSFQF